MKIVRYSDRDFDIYQTLQIDMHAYASRPTSLNGLPAAVPASLIDTPQRPRFRLTYPSRQGTYRRPFDLIYVRFAPD